MRKIILYMLLLLNGSVFSQAYTNVVADSGFEMLKPCYDTGAFYSLGSPQWMKYWQNGNEGSVDIAMAFTCAPSNTSLINYPATGGGYQYPRTGNCYAGLVAIRYPLQNNNFREYLRTPLLMPLEAGKKYYAGCYVSLGEGVNFYSINNFGIAFSDDTLTPDTSVQCVGCPGEVGVPILFNPQVMNDTTFNLNDTLGWVLVADTFIAQGGEQWLTIGNFRDDAHSIFVPTNHPNSSDSASYYFVDDVFIYCIDTTCATVPTIGVKENEKEMEGFKVYPNPTSDVLTIEFDPVNEKDNPTIVIYNMQGKLIFEKTLMNKEKTTTFSVENLMNGIYICKLRLNGVTLSTQRLVILK